MSTQPISNPNLQELQGFHHRATELPDGSTTSGKLHHHHRSVSPHGEGLSPAVVVTIQASQGQQVDQKDTFWHQRKEALDQLGAALQSGDTAAAQHAYDALVALGQNGPLRNGATFYRTDRAQDFAAIGQALQSGDLAGAQQAFATLESTFKHNSTTRLGPPTPGPGPLPPTPAPGPSVQPPQGTLPPTTVPPSTLPPSVQPPQGTLPPTTVPPSTLPPTTLPPSTQPPQGTLPPTPAPVPSTTGTSVPAEIVINLHASSTPEEVQINFGGNSGSAGQVTIDVSQQDGKEDVAINLNSGSANYQLVLNLLQSDSNSAAQSGSVSLQA